MPIQGGGKGKPGPGPASGAGAEPGAEAAGPAVVVAAPLGRGRAAEGKNRKSGSVKRPPLPFLPPLGCHGPQKTLTCTGGWRSHSLS